MSNERSIEDDLVCPITLELPFDPVTAEDGRVYERAAIEEYFETNKDNIKSPILNTPMGTKLFPAPQIKNHIEFLLEKDFITGDLATKWKTKAEGKKAVDALVKKAEAGDVEAMEEVGNNYYYAKNGFKKDHKASFQWYDTAHRAGSIPGTEWAGNLLLKNLDDDQNQAKGVLYLGMAAAQGSRYGAYHLGNAFSEGLGGLATDKAEAVYWLEKALTPPFGQLDESGQEIARKLLDKLQQEEN